MHTYRLGVCAWVSKNTENKRSGCRVCGSTTAAFSKKKGGGRGGARRLLWKPFLNASIVHINDSSLPCWGGIKGNRRSLPWITIQVICCTLKAFVCSDGHFWDALKGHRASRHFYNTSVINNYDLLCLEVMRWKQLSRQAAVVSGAEPWSTPRVFVPTKYLLQLLIPLISSPPCDWRCVN